MRRMLLAAAAATLAACTPPTPQSTTTATTTAPPAPTPVACNSLAPDLSKPVRLTPPPVAVAALPDLPGGPIRPGTYDLTAGNVLDGAPEWTMDRFVALDVSESDDGVVFNWVSTTREGDTQRWTATFHEGPPAQLSFTCGRQGDIAVHGEATDARLTLRMPDPSGSGADNLVFAKRG